MNNQAAQYLEKLNAGNVLIERVEAAVNTFRFLLGGEEPERIFVCNALDPAPDQFPYGSIWGFNGPFWMEARQKGPTWDVDIASYTGGIYYLSVQYVGIEFPGRVTDESKLGVEVQTDKTEYSSLSATGLNCGELIEIVDTLFRPHLKA